ncbi:hypothetical protein QWZ13_05155 [Reinekea marina]|uniref:hypothetical protein n=1 Tax=Reinekea marina TaxID=1310421 RepID=UPI0025B28C84|nr:hypothetical protein [Reinekea marina]MDN3648296.1 hypothetical protein [Reinekea marina]
MIGNLGHGWRSLAAHGCANSDRAIRFGCSATNQSQQHTITKPCITKLSGAWKREQRQSNQVWPLGDEPKPP